jgi:hypothetical protein
VAVERNRRAHGRPDAVDLALGSSVDQRHDGTAV